MTGQPFLRKDASLPTEGYSSHAVFEVMGGYRFTPQSETMRGTPPGYTASM